MRPRETRSHGAPNSGMAEGRSCLVFGGANWCRFRWVRLVCLVGLVVGQVAADEAGLISKGVIKIQNATECGNFTESDFFLDDLGNHFVRVGFTAETQAVDENHPGATGHDIYWPTNKETPGTRPLTQSDPNWWGSNYYGVTVELYCPLNGNWEVWFDVHYDRGTMPDTYRRYSVKFWTVRTAPWRAPVQVIPNYINPPGGVLYPQFPLLQAVVIDKPTRKLEFQGDFLIGSPGTTGPCRVSEVYVPRGGQRRSQTAYSSPYYASWGSERVQLTGLPSGVYEWSLKIATVWQGVDTWWEGVGRFTLDWDAENPITNQEGTGGGTGGTGDTGGTTPTEWQDPPETASDRLKALKDRFAELPPWGWVKAQGDAITAGGQVAGRRDFAGEWVLPGVTFGVDAMQGAAPVRLGSGFGDWKLDAQGEGAGGDFAGVVDQAGYESKFRLMLRAALWSMFVVGLLMYAKGRLNV